MTKKVHITNSVISCNMRVIMLGNTAQQKRRTVLGFTVIIRWPSHVVILFRHAQVVSYITQALIGSYIIWDICRLSSGGRGRECILSGVTLLRKVLYTQY